MSEGMEPAPGLTPADDRDYTGGLDTGEDEVVDLDEVIGSDEVDEALDTGYSPPEKPLGITRFGTTPQEARENETLDQRLRAEEPDDPTDTGAGTGALDDLAAEHLDDRITAGEDSEVGGRAALDGYAVEEELLSDGEVGDERAGRLVDPDEGAHEDEEKDMVGWDAGIDGGAASAEEAAMHVIREEEL